MIPIPDMELSTLSHLLMSYSSVTAFTSSPINAFGTLKLDSGVNRSLLLFGL